MTTRVNNRMIDDASVNVLDYGADPSGLTDSTSAIQNAINAAEYSIVFPKGTYLVTSQITASNKDYLEVKGFGATVSLNTSVLQPIVFSDIATLNISGLSVDCNNGQHWGMYFLRVGDVRISRDVTVKNIAYTSTLISGYFFRDCPEGVVSGRALNIEGTGGVARGFTVSDQTIERNNLIFDGIYVKDILGVDDSDGIYAEYTNSPYFGGITIRNSTFINCGKRFIKMDSPNVVIEGNRGWNNLGTEMFAFVSIYDQSNQVTSNIFETTNRCIYMVEAGAVKASNIGVTAVEGNTLKANVATASQNDYAFRIQYPATQVIFNDNLCVGTGGLVGSGSNATTADMISIRNNIVVNRADQQGITLNHTDIGTLSVSNNSFSVDAPSRFLVSLPNATTIGTSEITDNTGDFGFGSVSTAGGLRLAEVHGNSYNLIEFRRGLRHEWRNNLPTSGARLVGDKVWLLSPIAGGHEGWVCTTAGTVGVDAVYKEFSQIEA